MTGPLKENDYEVNVLISKHVILISGDKNIHIYILRDNANLLLSMFVGAMSYKCSALRHGKNDVEATLRLNFEKSSHLIHLEF